MRKSIFLNGKYTYKKEKYIIYIQKTNDLLFISRIGPNIKDFNFNLAIEGWKNDKKNRRFICIFLFLIILIYFRKIYKICRNL